MMKLVSWNVNGLRACVRKGFEKYFYEIDADIFCVQEIRLQEGQINLHLPGYEQYWNYAEKKGYSGTAVFTKNQPLPYHYGWKVEKGNPKGRIRNQKNKGFNFVNCNTRNDQVDLIHRV